MEESTVNERKPLVIFIQRMKPNTLVNILRLCQVGFYHSYAQVSKKMATSNNRVHSSEIVFLLHSNLWLRHFGVSMTKMILKNNSYVNCFK